MDDKAIQEARERLRQKYGDGGRIGGKGTVRRKKKVVHKAATVDDKRLQATLKRLGVNNIPGIEEVNIFKDDNSVIHFENPKVQASLTANTYVISGTAETKSLSTMLPEILTQMGPAGMKILQETIAKRPEMLQSMFGGAMAAGAAEGGDDSVPDLEADFEATSESK